MTPRPVRNESELNIYHVFISGNNNENVFADSEDKEQFIRILQDKTDSSECEVYAFCILCNKANLLIKPVAYPLSVIMQQINVSYAQYYNRKYSRTGHVFRDRYKSVPVNDLSQFSAVKRYISLNPVIEGVSEKPHEYKFSTAETEGCSFDDIFGYYDNCVSNLDQIAEALIGHYMEKHKISYDSLKQRTNFSRRTELVLLIKDSTGYSIRKISQLLDLNRGEVYRIIQYRQKEE